LIACGPAMRIEMPAEHGQTCDSKDQGDDPPGKPFSACTLLL